MRESRLFKIVYHLLEKGQATASELAEKFEVSVRTIYRDMDALSDAGIPIYAEAGRNGGIRLMHDFVLDKAVLSEKEKLEILTSLQSLQAVPDLDYNATLNKLSAVFQVSPENWLEVDFTRWGNQGSDNTKFETLKSAILQHKTMNISYAGSREAVSVRKIAPLRLLYKSRAWYVKAYCTQRKDLRLFKLTRILDWELTDEEFPVTSRTQLPPPSHQETAEAGGTQPEYPLITLRFAKETACRVYDEFDNSQVQRQENGDLAVSARMPADAWLTGFLLSFGTQVDVLSPAWLKKTLAEQAKMIYDKNKT